MNINWYGETCFKIVVQKDVNIIIDPPTKESGLRGPKLEANVLLSTDFREAVPSGQYFIISGPGEYDVKEVYFRGIQAQNSTIYVIEAEDIRICHLGKINQPELTTEQIEAMGEIDVLMIPVGGGQSLEAKSAVKIMSQVEPKIIIPMYYKIAKSKEKLGSVDDFLKVLGVKNMETTSRLSIKAKDLPKEEVKIIGLEA